jgi:hypothetical protein
MHHEPCHDQTKHRRYENANQYREPILPQHAELGDHTDTGRHEQQSHIRDEGICGPAELGIFVSNTDRLFIAADHERQREQKHANNGSWQGKVQGSAEHFADKLAADEDEEGDGHGDFA